MNPIGTHARRKERHRNDPSFSQARHLSVDLHELPVDQDIRSSDIESAADGLVYAQGNPSDSPGHYLWR
nr:hypothetical protein [Deltaproteobacteria bacterium]